MLCFIESLQNLPLVTKCLKINESEFSHWTQVVSKCLAGCLPSELLHEVGLDCFYVWSPELSKQLAQCLKGAVTMKVALRALKKRAMGNRVPAAVHNRDQRCISRQLASEMVSVPSILEI